MKREEKGAILVLAAGGMVLAMIASALAVDLGFLASEARVTQRIADLAALDAARVLPADPTAVAVQSAARNGQTASIPTNFKVECATAPAGPFSAAVCAAGTGTAVRVTATKSHTNKFPFVGSGRTVTRGAVSQVQNKAGFELGSALARVDASVQAPMLNRVFERFLGSSAGSITVTAVGYQGLAASYVKLGDLQSQLGFATVNELLSANLTVKQILQATSTVMNNKGIAGYADVNTIIGSIGPASVGNTTNIKLGDIIKVASGAEGAAASAGLNVLQLITASAELANKDAFVSVPNAITDIPVPGVGNVGTTIGLKVIEPSKTYIGPKGGSVTTSQVQVTFLPTINVGITLPLPVGSLLHAVGTLQVVVGGAGATGTLTDVRCTAPTQGITVRVDTAGATTGVTTPAPPVGSGPITLRTALNLVAGSLDVTGQATGATDTRSFNFAYPSQFSPTAPAQETNSAPVNTTVTGTTAGNVHIAFALINVNQAGTVVSGAVLTAVKPLLDQIAARLKLQDFAALGASVGVADVAALKDAYQTTGCGQPGLID